MAVPKKKLAKVQTLLKQANTLHNRHQLEQAAKVYQQILRIAPKHHDALNLLGLVRYQQGRFEEAGKLLEKAVQVKPDFKQAWLHYGNLRQQLRDYEGALQAFQRVLAIDPEYALALLNVGNCLRILGRRDEADMYYVRAIAADPTYSLAWANFGKLAYDKGDWQRAAKAADAAVDCPNPAPLGYSLWIQAHHLTKESSELAQRAKELLAHPGATGELLAEGHFLAHHIYGMEAEALLKARDRVEQQIAANVEPSIRDRVPSAAGRPRTIGLLSASFRRHPVAFMALGALEHLGRQGFKLIFYSGTKKEDAYTERFRRCADVWRDINHMSDEEVVETMRADGVDILFDMSGITNNGRPRIAAMRAAPLQIKWVGGQHGPSGIPNMDAFLTDPVESPEGAEADHHERLLRMPNGYVTYTPPIDCPEPAAQPPVVENGFITFGSLNKLAKLSAEVLRTWAQIMRQVPNSRLLMRTPGAEEASVQERVVSIFKEQGIDPDRLQFEGPAGHKEFLETYNRIDIALDSFPYTGGLTTCEALWMGVPVVALAGRFFSERHAATHLCNVGKKEWVAHSPEGYIAAAVRLAQNTDALADYRGALRSAVAQSPLCDHERYCADLAQLLRQEWVERFGEAAAEDSADSQSSRPSLAHAQALLEQGDPAAAINECKLLMESGEVSPQVLELAGVAAQASGHSADAVDMLSMALDMDPERVTTLQALLDIVEHLGEDQIADQLRSELDRVAG